MLSRLAITRSSPGRALSRHGAAFTLIESVVAMALCGVAISVFYSSISQAIRLARASRDTAVTAQLMQQRVDSLRNLSPWAKVIKVPEVAALFSTASPVPADFPPATEVMTMAPYPADGSAFSVSRTSAGAVTTSGASLPASVECVQVTLQYSWTQHNRRTVTRSLSTILTKGGL